MKKIAIRTYTILTTLFLISFFTFLILMDLGFVPKLIDPDDLSFVFLLLGLAIFFVPYLEGDLIEDEHQKKLKKMGF